jgi:threonine dehydrogenase-like Zn-dependent dehydrogenase
MGIVNADGSFAEYLAIPVRNLHLVPETLADEEAVFTEPLAAAFAILEQVHLRPDTVVVVLGDGKLGVLCAQVLHNAGARVTVVGKHPQKLRIVQKRGLRTVLLPDWRPQRQADAVVEATGAAAGLKLAIETVRPRGTLVLKSTVAREHIVSLAPLVVHEVTVIGSRCGPFPPALRALDRQEVVVAPLVEAVYSLTEGVEAINHAARPGVLKVLLRNQ